MSDAIVISETDGAISAASIGAQGPAGVSAVISGLVTLNGSAGVVVTFTNTQTSANYVVAYEQQTLSDSGKFVTRSPGEYSTQSKTITGFTVYTSENLVGVIARYSLNFY